MERRSLIVAGVVAASALTIAVAWAQPGEDPGTSTVASCSTIWRPGVLLPADYIGCAQERPGEYLECAGGGTLASHGRLYARAGDVIVETRELETDAGYVAAVVRCLGHDESAPPTRR